MTRVASVLLLATVVVSAGCADEFLTLRYWFGVDYASCNSDDNCPKGYTCRLGLDPGTLEGLNTAGPGVCAQLEDYVVERASDLDALAGVVDIDGSLTIRAGVEDVSLPDLTRVGGAVVVDDASDLATLSLPALETLGLGRERVTRVAADRATEGLRIVGAPNLATLDLSSLRVVEPRVDVEDTGLETLALPALLETAHESAFSRSDTREIGAVRVVGNDSLRTLALPAFTALRGAVELRDNAVLTDVDLRALRGERRDDGTFDEREQPRLLIDDAPALATLRLDALHALGALTLADTGLAALVLPALVATYGPVAVRDNPRLNELDTPRWEEAVGPLLFDNTPSLACVLIDGVVDVTGAQLVSVAGAEGGDCGYPPLVSGGEPDACTVDDGGAPPIAGSGLYTSSLAGAANTFGGNAWDGCFEGGGPDAYWRVTGPVGAEIEVVRRQDAPFTDTARRLAFVEAPGCDPDAATCVGFVDEVDEPLVATLGEDPLLLVIDRWQDDIDAGDDVYFSVRFAGDPVPCAPTDPVTCEGGVMSWCDPAAGETVTETCPGECEAFADETGDTFDDGAVRCVEVPAPAPDSAPLFDTCARADVFAAPEGGASVTFDVDLGGLAAHYPTTCGSPGDVDGVFALRPPDSARLTTVSTDTPGVTFSLHDDACRSTTPTCSADVAGTQTASFDPFPLRNDIFVIVEATPGTPTATFTLTAEAP